MTSTNAQKQLFDGINEVTAIDDVTLEIGLDAPKGSLLTNLAWGDAVIVSPASIDTDATNPVGTGPFKFSQWVQGDRVELVEEPRLLGRAGQARQGDLQVHLRPHRRLLGDDGRRHRRLPELSRARRTSPSSPPTRASRCIVGSTEGETILAMNNARAPFDDIRVRQAVAHAIDRQAIIDGAMFGYGTPIGSHFAPHNPAYEDLTALSAYDPEKSKALLAEASLADGFKTTLALPPPSYARRGGEIVASQLRAVGIDAEIVNVEWAQWLEQVFKNKDFGLTIVSHTEPMDIEIYARPDYYFGYDDPVMRALIHGLDATADEAEQRRDPAGGAGAGGRALRQRLPLPARQDRRRGRAHPGPLGELADAGQRHDRGLLGRVGCSATR